MTDEKATIVENEISITFLPNARMEQKNFNVWKPFMLKFCKENAIKSIKVGHDDIVSVTESDTLYLYCNILDFSFQDIATKYLSCELSREQGYIHTGVGGNPVVTLHFYDRCSSTVGWYIPSLNSILLADVIHVSNSITLLEEISKSITSGNYLIPLNNLMIHSTINIVKEQDIKPFIDPILANISKVFKENLKKIQDNNKSYLEAALARQISLPAAITENKVRFMKFSDNGKNGLGILYPSMFRLKKVVRGVEQYDVSSITHNHDIMVCVIVNQKFEVRSIKLYTKSMLNQFLHLHRRTCIFDNLSEICLGTYQDGLFKTKVDTNKTLYQILEKVDEIISTVFYGDIAGRSDDMLEEYDILVKIGNHDPEYEKYRIGEGWTVPPVDNVKSG